MPDSWQEEIFGPVAPVRGFADEDKAIAATNDTEYGLVAYAFTSDLKRALRVCEGLETGMVGLNQGMVSNAAAPFGGIKRSGFGHEGGPEGIDEYLETSTSRSTCSPADIVRRGAPVSRNVPATHRLSQNPVRGLYSHGQDQWLTPKRAPSMARRSTSTPPRSRLSGGG